MLRFMLNKHEKKNLGVMTCKSVTITIVCIMVVLSWLPGPAIYVHVGCGKTTFLDLLTGRRHTGTIQVKQK